MCKYTFSYCIVKNRKKGILKKNEFGESRALTMLQSLKVEK